MQTGNRVQQTEGDTMRFINFPKQKITFESFLCGTPARDYIVQKQPYEEQIKAAADMLAQADYVLIGAGAGMSAAAGAQYGGTFFKENFGEFQEKYGNGPYMQDMYAAGFYPYPDEESYWGYWSKQAMLGGIQLDVTPLHRLLLDALSDREIFVLSTNESSAPRVIISTCRAGRDAMIRFMMRYHYFSRWIRRDGTAGSHPTWCRNARCAVVQWI